LRGLHRFNSTVSAVEEITSIQDGKIGKGLKQFLLDEIVDKGKGKDRLAVVDSKLGTITFSVDYSILLED
jgi:nucleolar protein 58